MESTTFARQLAASHQEFLSFLQRELRGSGLAEDVLQSAYQTAAEQAGVLRDGASGRAWFYRVLRNAVVDVRRRASREARALQVAAAEPKEEAPGVPPSICRCVGALVESLRGDQARLIRRVDLEGAAVPLVGREEGITANLAGVRLYRARAALRDKLRRVCGVCAASGCLDCGCPPQRPGAASAA
ncbi:MAG: hypothetical protein NVSMB23_07750 [Myxococcales bacterium]